MKMNRVQHYRLRPTQCNYCGNYEFIKMSSGNNLASYKCNMCRNGRPVKQPTTLADLQAGRNTKVVALPRASHEKRK